MHVVLNIFDIRPIILFSWCDSIATNEYSSQKYIILALFEYVCWIKERDIGMSAFIYYAM